MYRPTTALSKIAELSKPIRVVQGGQGAGKTIGIEMIIQNHAQHNPNKEITIIQAELSKLKKTAMRDFEKILRSFGMWDRKLWNKTESTYTFPNNSYVEFIGLDHADVGKGFRRDLVYFNELNKGGITLDTFIQFQSRAEVTYADFNPDKKFWLHDEIIPDPDTDFLILTYNDNEYIPDGEKRAILKYKEKGFFNIELPFEALFKEENIKSKYWANKWRVYGLGLPGALDGVIFSNWSIIERVPPLASYEGSGLDFGFTNDPTTIIDNYKYNGKRIWDEHLYITGMVNGDIARSINDGTKRLVYADQAEPKSIEEIRRHGVRILGADKGRDSINFGIDLLQQEDFYVTKRSVHLIEELESYTWATEKDGSMGQKPVDNWNHCIDAMRYFAMMKMKTNVGRYAVR